MSTSAHGPDREARQFLDHWDQRLSAWACDGAPPLASAGPRMPDRSFAPRPLVLHLALAGGLAARASAEAAGLAPDLLGLLDPPDPAPPDLLRGAAVMGAALERSLAMLRGIDAYRQHPWCRPAETRPVLWQRGSARLLDHNRGGAGKPVLVIPSLVNRAHVLDLLPERSLLDWLAGNGHRPLLMDWGEPGAAEAGFDLASYVTELLVPAVEQAAAGQPVNVLGYCMGGDLALALATLRPDLCHRMALVATPWDFAAPQGAAGLLREVGQAMGPAALRTTLDRYGETLGGIPVDFLQAIFALLDPNLVARKFAKFAELPADGLAARLFTATEDWLNDGVPLAPRAGAELLVGWCLENAPGRDCWVVNGTTIRPEGVPTPTLVVASEGDRIAPFASVVPLAHRMPEARLHTAAAGHVGMMVGRNARRELWEPLVSWFGD